MIDWIDRLLLSVSRDTMDLIAMLLAAMAVIYVTLVVVKIVWAMNKREDLSGEREE